MMHILTRRAVILGPETDLLTMPDERLEYLAREYKTQARDVPFHQFAADRNLAINIDLKRNRRKAVRHPQAREFLPL